MKDMNTISKCLLTVIATTVTIAGCIYAGKVEYEDEVLSGMSAEKYQYIHDSLGHRASQEDVIKEYSIMIQNSIKTINNYGRQKKTGRT